MAEKIWFASCLVACLIASVGCGGEPTLYPVTGKITLGGKPYDRLIVYFRPINRKVDKYNLGVGETDAQGQLGMRSSAGSGIPVGHYRVAFTCLVQKSNRQPTPNLDQKADDNSTFETLELVPDPFNDGENSPIEFEVTAGGSNVFDYDIPAK